MSGYLQRLARSAMMPARSIHPAAGSIFSPPKDERMTAPLLEYEEIETAGNRAESLAPTRPTMPSRAAHAPTAPEGEARDDRPIRKDGEPRPVFQPIAPIPQGDASPISRPRKTQLPSEEFGPLQNPEAVPQPDIQLLDGESYTPLLPPKAQTADAEGDVSRPSQTVVSAAPKKEAFGVPSHALASQHEPDEIQIHIGRIEVTAVPQTVPRPAVVPASKSINLDEYLRRERGRAR